MIDDLLHDGEKVKNNKNNRHKSKKYIIKKNKYDESFSFSDSLNKKDREKLLKLL